MSVELAFWCLFFVMLILDCVLHISIVMSMEDIKEEIIDEIRKGEE